jgi:hypothetical protein
MSELGKRLVSLISTRASTQEPDPEFDLIHEVMRRSERRDYAGVLLRVGRLIHEHGSAESALAALEHEATGRSE